MKRRRAIRNLIVTGAVLYSSLTPGAAPAGDVPDYVIHSDVRLVLLDVSVKSRNAARVTGLSKDDFRIDENGVPQEITVFANKDVPVTVGIVVDNSRSMLPKRAEVLSAATTFIEESNPQDEIFVLTIALIGFCVELRAFRSSEFGDVALIFECIDLELNGRFF